MDKKLCKSTTDKKIAGVCGGIANYLNLDATLVRVLYVLAAVLTTGIPFTLIYIILALVMPEETTGV